MMIDGLSTLFEIIRQMSEQIIAQRTNVRQITEVPFELVSQNDRILLQ